MAERIVVSCLFCQTSETTGVIAGSGEVSLVGTGTGSKSIKFLAAGGMLRFDAGGRLYTIQNGAMSLRLRLKKGTTVIADTGLIVLSTNYAGDSHWNMHVVVMASATTTVFAHGRFEIIEPAAGLTTPLVAVMGTAAGSSTTVSSSAEDFNLTGEYATDIAASYINCRTITVEEYGAA